MNTPCMAFLLPAKGLPHWLPARAWMVVEVLEPFPLAGKNMFRITNEELDGCWVAHRDELLPIGDDETCQQEQEYVDALNTSKEKVSIRSQLYAYVRNLLV